MNNNTSIINITTQINDIPYFISNITISTNVWFSGCHGLCSGCHNKELHIQKEGLSSDLVKNELYKRKNISEWCLLIGGEPLFNDINIYYSSKVIEYSKKIGYKIFLYTGYDYKYVKEVLNNNIMKKIDYIKTGKYIESLKKEKFDNEYFYASINQKIIDKNGNIIYEYE